MPTPPMIQALCEWFDREGRSLPWRTRRTGYTALVSEAMLQQTQVSRVVDRYKRFMREFPTLRALASADEESVLAQWQGMGYYRRARNLHAAARMIVRDFGGRVPPDVEDLMRLPGVGRYTAGAIASIAFNNPAPIVDGNVERVLLRVSARRSSPMQSHAFAWKEAQALVGQAPRPGTWNEALMELGATVCLPAPHTPRCDACPIAKWCRARNQGFQLEIPPPKVRATPRQVHHHAMIVLHEKHSEILLERRSDSGMWAGMWQVPTIESSHPLNARELANRTLVKLHDGFIKQGEFTHKTSHRVIRFHIYLARGRMRQGTWRAADALDDLPMSNAQRRVLTFIGGPQSPEKTGSSAAIHRESRISRARSRRSV